MPVASAHKSPESNPANKEERKQPWSAKMVAVWYAKDVRPLTFSGQDCNWQSATRYNVTASKQLGSIKCTFAGELMHLELTLWHRAIGNAFDAVAGSLQF